MIIENSIFSEDIPEKGAGKGHVRFNLKSKSPEDVSIVGFCANLTASLLFERLQAQGTNLIMTLDKTGGTIDVLARYENDGVNVIWPAKQLDPAQFSDAQERIKNKTFFIGKETDGPKVKAETPTTAQSTAGDDAAARETSQHRLPPSTFVANNTEQPRGEDTNLTEEEENHLIKQLHRVP